VPGPPVDGEIEVIAGPATKKLLKGAVVPDGVVTVTVREPGAAPGAIVVRIDRLVAPGEVMIPVTPVPLNATLVACERFCPKIVPGTVVPAAPDSGEIAVMEGAATVKPLKGAVVPKGVVTVTVRGPSAAPGAIVTSIERLVAPGDVIAAVTPVPLNVTAVAPERS